MSKRRSLRPGPGGRRLVLLLACFLAACASHPAPDLDALAERHVRLALEIGTHEDGYIDAYYGDPTWKTEAEANPRSVADLKEAMDSLSADIASVLEQTSDPAVQRRARTLAAYVASGRFRLDMIEGTRVPFVEEAERLFAIRPHLRPLDNYEPVLARIDSIVPGSGPLAERVEAFRSRFVIPPDRLMSVMEAAIAECRNRTSRWLTLPENEQFDLELVKDRPWGAYNWYLGENHSLIQVNTDIPLRIDAAVVYGCHEGYPGHHVQGMFAERMYRENAWVEFSVLPLFSPQGTLFEGGGDFGVELAFPGKEKLDFEREVLYPLAGLDTASAATYDQLVTATDELDGASLTIAQMYLDGEVDRAQASDLMQRYVLTSPERAEVASLREHPVSADASGGPVTMI